MAKSKFSIAHNDDEMRNLINETDHKILAQWGIDCAERVMHYFENSYATDFRPKYCMD